MNKPTYMPHNDPDVYLVTIFAYTEDGEVDANFVVSYEPIIGWEVDSLGRWLPVQFGQDREGRYSFSDGADEPWVIAVYSKRHDAVTNLDGSREGTLAEFLEYRKERWQRECAKVEAKADKEPSN